MSLEPGSLEPGPERGGSEAKHLKNIVILGSTGSIGTQTLDVVRRLPYRLRVVGLSAYRSETLLREQAAEFGVPTNALESGDAADLVRLATLPEADIVVVSVAGAVGTAATVATLKAGKDVALATKEVLVAAGAIVTAEARHSGAKILPIDSEHSAIFQCLQGQPPAHVSKLWLTASGGPFRQWPKDTLDRATVANALNHPTWPSMGRKITVDSATLMNKALETIEARWLFDVPMEQIGVVVHPQSVVHSLVELLDGSVLAQMGLPDMRLPIEYALLYPDRANLGVPRFDIAALQTPLTFEPPDESRFPALGMARRAAAVGGTLPAVMNAANEAAVGLFLDGHLTFGAITTLTERTMDAHAALPEPTLAQITEADGWARTKTHALLDEDHSLLSN